MQKEIWKDIPDFPGYQVSDQGKVRSLSRIVKRGNVEMNIKGKNLKFGTSMGYSFVNLRRNNKSISIKVHRLVAKVFIPNPNNRPEIDHINTNRKDNRKENLRWVNRHENNMNPLTRKQMSISKKKNYECCNS